MPLWTDKKLLVVVGPGGVGKTTISASLALASAASGLSTLVLTVDPSKRLAQAMSVDANTTAPQRIPKNYLEQHGLALAKPLDVLILQPKSVFDALVEQAIADKNKRQLIYDNPIYLHFSTQLAGAHDYAAVQKLHEITQSNAYDLIIVDTPPAQNAVDFLSAPTRIADFFEQTMLQWFLKSARAMNKKSFGLLSWGSHLLMSALAKLAGGDTIHVLTEFLLHFEGIYEMIQKHARAVEELLLSADSGFIIVTSPQYHHAHIAWDFYQKLTAMNYFLQAVVVNRVHTVPHPQDVLEHWQKHKLIQQQLGVYAVEATSLLQQELQRVAFDQTQIQTWNKMYSRPIKAIRELPHDVCDLEALVAVYKALLT